MVEAMLNRVVLNDPKEDLLRVKILKDPKLTKPMVAILLLTISSITKSKHMLNLINQHTDHLESIHNFLKNNYKFTEEEIQFNGFYSTPSKLVNQMLDVLPQETWSNPSLKFLDPCTGFGVVVIELVSRLMKGLEEWEPNRELRYKHIVENMIYAYDILEVNCFMLSFILDPFSEYTLNVKPLDYLTNRELKTFDISLLTAPFKSFSTNGRASTPFYSKFILEALKHSKQVVSINPAIWTVGGKGLGSLRRKLIGKGIIKSITNIDTKIYNNPNITSKVHILHLDTEYEGYSNINGTDIDLKGLNIIPTDINCFSILYKLKNTPSIKNIARHGTFMRIDYRKGRENRLMDYKPSDNFIKCYVSRAKNLVNYIDPKEIERNSHHIESYKVITEALSADGFGETFIVDPNEVSSDAYLTFITTNSLESRNLVTYLKTKFANYLLNLRKLSLHTTKDTLAFIPMVDLTKEWTDELLFKHFKLTKQEINLILN
jgi:site-specific DNA-methyltransferase (adenine-specific)